MLAQSGDGRTLARATLTIPAGAASSEAAIALPPELRNRLSRLVLEGPPSAGSVVLLDERWRRRPVGLSGGRRVRGTGPLTGSLYYLKRALDPFTEVREGDIATLLARQMSVLILADRPLPDGAERDALERWVEKGGLLIRFAGPRTAEQPIGQPTRCCRCGCWPATGSSAARCPGASPPGWPRSRRSRRSPACRCRRRSG